MTSSGMLVLPKVGAMTAAVHSPGFGKRLCLQAATRKDWNHQLTSLLSISIRRFAVRKNWRRMPLARAGPPLPLPPARDIRPVLYLTKKPGPVSGRSLNTTAHGPGPGIAALLGWVQVNRRDLYRSWWV